MEWLSNIWTAWLAVIPFALFFGALAIVTKGKAAIDDARRSISESSTNLAIFLFDTIIILPFIAIPAYWIVDQIGISSGLKDFWSGLPIALSCIGAVVIGDYVGYWRHRLEHIPLLWPAHATHHSDREMNWFTLNRMHPINRLTTVTIDSSLLTLLGFPLWAIIANGFIRNAWGYFIHADLRWTLGPVGWVLISPSAHRWHHAKDLALSGKNFATVFTLWDRLHGTYQPSKEPCSIDTGVDGHSGGFVFEIMHPAKLMVQKMRSWRRSSQTQSQIPTDQLNSEDR